MEVDVRSLGGRTGQATDGTQRPAIRRDTRLGLLPDSHCARNSARNLLKSPNRKTNEKRVDAAPACCSQSRSGSRYCEETVTVGAPMEGKPPVCVMTPEVSKVTPTVGDLPGWMSIEVVLTLTRESAGMVKVEIA